MVPAGSQSVMGVPSLAVLDSAEVLDVVDPTLDLKRLAQCTHTHTPTFCSNTPTVVTGYLLASHWFCIGFQFKGSGSSGTRTVFLICFRNGLVGSFDC